MVKKILIGLAAVILVLVIVVALQPSEFRVSRTALIGAPPATVFAQVNDFHKWNDWSPWAKIDPAAKYGFEGSASGVGAVFTWSGNNEVGEGRMTITASRSAEFVQYRLDFVKPFAATSTAEFALESKGEQTQVTWTMYGKNDFLSKAVSLVVNCDKMLGGYFEKGLAQLDAVAKAETKK